MPSPKMLLTSEDVARRFNVSVDTVRYWNRQGWVNFTRTPGGHLRLDPDELKNIEAMNRNSNHKWRRYRHLRKVV